MKPIQTILTTQVSFIVAITVVATLLAACASPIPVPPKNLEVIDTLTLPTGKSIAEFNRDSTVETRKDGDNTVAEYRLKGQLYKMVVTPTSGIPYTLLDEKGDGKFVRQGDPNTRVIVPMWVLLRW